MSECQICLTNTITNDNNCIECKNSWCNTCSINMSSDIINSKHGIGIFIKCPFCKTYNDKSIYINDNHIQASIMKKQFFELKEIYKKDKEDTYTSLSKLKQTIDNITKHHKNTMNTHIEMKRSLLNVTSKIDELKNKRRRTINIKELEHLLK